MAKFIVIILCMFILHLKSVEMKAVIGPCSDYDTECVGNGIMKVAVDSTDMDLQPASAGGKTNLFQGIVATRTAKNCGDQNCSRLSAAAPLPQMTDMSSSTKLPVYPAVFSFGPADNINNGINENNRVLTRFKRFPKACNESLAHFIPVDNAVITCYVWTHFLRCEIACGHGFAVKEDDKILKKTERKCRETEDYWYPYPSFPRCQPYINCKTELIGAGTLNCNTSSSVNSPSYCDISCIEDYEHDSLPTARYECVNENYDKVLPFCAAPDKSEKLIGNPINV